MKKLVDQFNAGQNGIHIGLTCIPEGSYNAQVPAAALAGDLPDVLEFDGPFTYNYVWQGHRIPLSGRLSKSLRDRLIPSIIEQGMYRGALEAAGVHLPMEPAGAWTNGSRTRSTRSSGRRAAGSSTATVSPRAAPSTVRNPSPP